MLRSEQNQRAQAQEHIEEIMAKSKKDKVKNKALSGGSLNTHEAVTQFFNNIGRLPDIDKTLRKAGIQRHNLDVLLDDDEIGQATETRLDALLATPFRIEPSDTPEAVYLMQEMQEWFSEIATSSLNALFYGYSVQEANWDYKDGYIGLSWIGEKPMEWFEPKNDGRLIYRPDSTGVEREIDQTIKFFLTRRKATYKQPYGKALLSTLYWLFFFKQNGFKFWAKFLERFGTPILLGKVSSNGSDDEGDIDAMNNALLSAHAQSVISIDAGDDVQILSNTQGNAGAAFDTFHTVILRQIQKLILGQTLTSGTDGNGSRALGLVHENVRKDKLKSDIRLVTPTLQMIINAMCTLNEWSHHKIIIGDDKALNEAQAKRDVDLKNSGAEFTNQYFTREYGLQDGDLKDSQQLPSQFTAIPKTAFSFAATVNKTNQGQQEIDSLIKAQSSTLLSDSDIEKIVENSNSQDELMQNLYSASKGATLEEFEINLAKALFKADVIGYVQANKRS